MSERETIVGRTVRSDVFLIGGDFSQIEPKIMALYSQDPELLKIFRTGQDLYISLMSKVLRKPSKNVTDDQRKIGKVLILGMLYGMGWRIRESCGS